MPPRGPPGSAQAATRAAEVVWHRGLLKKGPGLCHGLTGNGYALLRVYRSTNDRRWLRRAQQVGSFLCSARGRADWETPDSPLRCARGVGRVGGGEDAGVGGWEGRGGPDHRT